MRYVVDLRRLLGMTLVTALSTCIDRKDGNELHYFFKNCKLVKSSLFKSSGNNEEYLCELTEILQNRNSCAANWSSS